MVKFCSKTKGTKNLNKQLVPCPPESLPSDSGEQLLLALMVVPSNRTMCEESLTEQLIM